MMSYLTPNWPAPASVQAYTTLRTSWGVDSTAAKSPESSAQLISLLNLPADPLWIRQTHSTIAIEATLANRNQEADASFSSNPNHVCAVLTADCLPILVCNKEGTQVAAIHAGWRGLAGGVVEETIKKMNQDPDNLLIWLGPAIGPTQFEVGQDVYDAFLATHTDSATAFKAHNENKWLANLYELAKIRLKHLGISQIYGGKYCTYSQPDLFYSYRRDKGQTGRMASVIWIDSLN